ncbi:MAG: hypothetical protein R2853_02995 [Thermomicrobiales bacterium]
MDTNSFDHLTRTLSHPRARRGLLAVLAALPVPGGLLARTGDEAEARPNQRRKKHRHNDRTGRGSAGAHAEKNSKKKRKKKCKKRRQTICDGQCGTITFKCNKRKQTVDCGSCACNPPCPTCQRCNETTRTCEPDPGQQGQRCGNCRTCESTGVCGAPACHNPTPICVNDTCTACSTELPCPDGEYCDNGACLPCDVCSGGGCQFDSVQAAIDAASAGSTLHICAGKYAPATVSKNLTLIGAGDGSGPATNTILDGNNSARVVYIPTSVTATLQSLRITGGNHEYGGGVRNDGVLTLSHCTVTDNQSNAGGGLVNGGSSGNLTLNDCTVTRNKANGLAGGIWQSNVDTLILNNTRVVENDVLSGDGGGVVVGPVGSAQILNGTEITKNDTVGNGGGLYIYARPSDSLTFESSATVAGNRALSGGGIFRQGTTTVTLNGAAVEDNSPNNCVGLTC